jgi:3-oxoacyl-[acyl-carrier-protein] synthase III
MTWINAIQTTLLVPPPSINERIVVAKTLVTKEAINPKNISVVLSTGIDFFIQPSDSVAIASGIKANHALCATINNSCASISAAIDLAMNKIKGQPEEIAIVTSSSIFNDIFRDRKPVNYANGVGASIISNKKGGFKIEKIAHQKNASFFGLKTIVPMVDNPKKLKFNENKIDPLWNTYRQVAIDFPVDTMKTTLREHGWNLSEVDHWILHSSELTKSWISNLGLGIKQSHPNMGALSSLAQLDKLMTSGNLMPKNKIAVLELALGMSVSIVLLEYEGEHNELDQ